MTFVVKLINFVCNLFVDFINSIINLLPESPFSDIKLFIDSTYLAYLNWLFPISEIITLVGSIITIYLSYFAISFILRLFKVIR